MPLSVLLRYAMLTTMNPNRRQRETDMTEENRLEITDGILMRCSGGARKIVLPKTVRSIAAQAFVDCTDVEEIEIPGNQIRLPAEHIFSGCTALKKLSLWGEAEDAAGSRFTSRVRLKEYLGLSEDVQLEWECPTVWCLEDRCQFCGGALRGDVMRVCSFCGRIN